MIVAFSAYTPSSREFFSPPAPPPTKIFFWIYLLETFQVATAVETASLTVCCVLPFSVQYGFCEQAGLPGRSSTVFPPSSRPRGVPFPLFFVPSCLRRYRFGSAVSAGSRHMRGCKIWVPAFFLRPLPLCRSCSCSFAFWRSF